MTSPRLLDPETSAWLQMQIALSSTRAAAAATHCMAQEMRKVEDWANGLFLVLQDVLPPLLRENDELREQLAARWRAAAERFDQVKTAGQDAALTESLETLEARKILYRMYKVAGLWNPRRPGTRAREARS